MYLRGKQQRRNVDFDFGKMKHVEVSLQNFAVVDFVVVESKEKQSKQRQGKINCCSLLNSTRKENALRCLKEKDSSNSSRNDSHEVKFDAPSRFLIFLLNFPKTLEKANLDLSWCYCYCLHYYFDFDLLKLLLLKLLMCKIHFYDSELLLLLLPLLLFLFLSDDDELKEKMLLLLQETWKSLCVFE